MLTRVLALQLIFLLSTRTVIASPPRPTENERSFVKFEGEVRSVRIVTEQDYSWSHMNTGKKLVHQTRIYPKLQIGFTECKDLGKGFSRYQGFCNNPNFSYFPFCDSQTAYKTETDHKVFLGRKVSGFLSIMATGPCISRFIIDKSMSSQSGSE